MRADCNSYAAKRASLSRASHSAGQLSARSTGTLIEHLYCSTTQIRTYIHDSVLFYFQYYVSRMVSQPTVAIPVPTVPRQSSHCAPPPASPTRAARASITIPTTKLASKSMTRTRPSYQQEACFTLRRLPIS